VSDGSTATGDAVNVFPWIKAGGAGHADAVWYGSNLSVEPQQPVRAGLERYMSQVVYATDSTGAVTGAAPSATLVKVSPHPMHYNDVCLAGTGCIAQQGNRNLADFFAITIDHTGAAEIVYDDTSNGLAQRDSRPLATKRWTTPARALSPSRGSPPPCLFGTNVSGPSNAPTSGITDNFACALPSHWRQERSRNGHPEQLHQSVGQHLDGNDESRGSFQIHSRLQQRYPAQHIFSTLPAGRWATPSTTRRWRTLH